MVQTCVTVLLYNMVKTNVSLYSFTTWLKRKEKDQGLLKEPTRSELQIIKHHFFKFKYY